MLGWQIFVHSVRMVFGNFRQALQIALVPVAISYALVVAFSFNLGISLETFTSEEWLTQRMSEPGGFTLALFGLWFVQLLLMLWVIVAWHRFVLLEEYPNGWIPPVYPDRILSYIGHGLLLFVLGVVLGIPLGIVAVIFGFLSEVLVLVTLIIGVIALLICLYRVFVILPAAAIGRPIKLSEAWASTKNANGQLVLLLLITTVAQLVFNLGSLPLLAIPVVGYLVSYAVNLVLYLINVSVLTTMYGVFIEKRELA